MQKNTRKLPQITEKIQVGCMWKMIGFFDNRNSRPNRKLLSSAKNRSNKHVTGTGSPRVRDDTTSLDKKCKCIANASENQVVAVDIGAQIEDGEMQKSSQLLDALEILDSNSELFLKLLQDPNSLLVKQICNTKDSQTEKDKTKTLQENELSQCSINAITRKFQKPEMEKSFLERIKSQYGCPSMDSDIPSTSNSIVVLKSKPNEQGRYKLGKRRDLESKSRTSPEIATTSKSRTQCTRVPQIVESGEGQMFASTSESSCENVHLSNISYSSRRDFEAKRRLSERLRNVERGENLSTKQSPKTLRRILSSPLTSPEHDFSATFSPKRDRDASIYPPVIFSTCGNFELASENSSQLKNEAVSTCNDYIKLHDQLQMFDSKAKILESVTDDLSSDGYKMVMEMNGAIQSRDINLSEMPSKQNNVFITSAERNINTTKTCEENRYLDCSMEESCFNFPSPQDSHLENQAVTVTSSADVASSNLINVYEVEIEDSTKDREEHLSPVSVLDPLFITSPSSTANQPAKPQMQPFHIDFEDYSLAVDPTDSNFNISSCIRTVSQAFGLNWDELSKNSRPSCQLLYNSSFDEHNLFRDFINDVLLEVNQRNLECSYWVSFFRPDIRCLSVQGKDVVEEVMKEVQWYLVPSAMPRTLDIIVGKDMEKPISWRGMRLDTEDIVIQIVDYVLDETIMETIFVIEK